MRTIIVVGGESKKRGDPRPRRSRKQSTRILSLCPRCASAGGFFMPLIHRSAWKGNSANFAFHDFSEVRGSKLPHSGGALANRGGAFGLRPLRPSFASVARGRRWCDHDYPRWGGHNNSATRLYNAPRARRTGFSHRVGVPTGPLHGAPALRIAPPRYKELQLAGCRGSFATSGDAAWGRRARRPHCVQTGRRGSLLASPRPGALSPLSP